MPLDQILLNTSTTDQPQQYHDHGDHQQNMNEATDGSGRDEAKKPQDEKNYGNCIKHVFPLVSNIACAIPPSFDAIRKPG